MIEIDGSLGEGGGQILRTALSLSMITGRGFRIKNLRAGRKKPGLLHQHLTAVKAASRIAGAHVNGMELGSTRLTFEPQEPQPGHYEFDIGTAGSTTLVLQTVLPPLLLARQPSKIILKGGTHNPMAPPVEFLSRTFLPLLERQGARVSLDLKSYGFYPGGGGIIETAIDPAGKLLPLHLEESLDLLSIKTAALVCRLPESIAQRELDELSQKLGSAIEGSAIINGERSGGPGNAVFVHVETGEITETFSALGKKGLRAEMVAGDAARQAKQYLETGAPVGEHLADQLLLPLALAGSGSFITGPPSSHTLTNIETIREFLDVRIEMQADDRKSRVKIVITS
ncbi:MAG: RNA 3'-terminal phosphate cyclase [Cyanobacteria bacterium HKST-UBA02]|nr:RNA 3'-terminal phosphate cyclase [Cyanobacteria bacterium HKST-UBA02]